MEVEARYPRSEFFGDLTVAEEAGRARSAYVPVKGEEDEQRRTSPSSVVRTTDDIARSEKQLSGRFDFLPPRVWAPGAERDVPFRYWR